MSDFKILDAAPEKICLFCEHFNMDMAEQGYSEVTPGRDFSMECFKNKWEYKTFGTEVEYYTCIITARKCSDYAFNPKIWIDINA